MQQTFSNPHNTPFKEWQNWFLSTNLWHFSGRKTFHLFWNIIVWLCTMYILCSIHFSGLPKFYLLENAFTVHSSEIRSLCLMKCPSKMLQNLPYFIHKKNPKLFQKWWRENQNFKECGHAYLSQIVPGGQHSLLVKIRENKGIKCSISR